MIISGIKGKTVLPTEVADYLYYKTSNFNKTGGGTSARGIVDTIKHYGLKYEITNTEAKIVEALSQGYYILGAVENNKFVVNGSHELILSGYKDGKTYVYDPYDSTNNGWYAVSYLFKTQSKNYYDRLYGIPFFKITD